jgi:endonuclease YncB( thermonuclease family)
MQASVAPVRRSSGLTMAWTCAALVVAALATATGLVRPSTSPSAPERAHAAGETTYAGPARVVDGDTLVVEGRRIRIFGIDAPERRQDCTRDGEPYRCGDAASAALAQRIGERPISCSVRDTDRYGRAVAQCAADGQDLGGWMVAQGWAVAYTRYARDYVADEAGARAARRGLWNGAFELPAQWRREQRAGAQARRDARALQPGLIAGAPGAI